MGRSLRLFSTVLLLLLVLLAPAEMGENQMMVAEAKICEYKSHMFKGLCFSDTNCGTVCTTEGFTGGRCGGFRRQCYCTKNCTLQET